MKILARMVDPYGATIYQHRRLRATDPQPDPVDRTAEVQAYYTAVRNALIARESGNLELCGAWLRHADDLAAQLRREGNP